MWMTKCDTCGESEFKRMGNMCECSFCVRKYILDAFGNWVSEPPEVILDSLIQNSKKLHSEGKFLEELNILTKALNMDRNNTGTLVKLGRCYRSLNLTTQALDCYERALILNPHEWTAYANMGAIYIVREDYIHAAECYERGLSMAERQTFDYWVANAIYAIAIAKLGNPKRAEKMIKASEKHGYKKGDILRKIAGIEPTSLAHKIKTLFS